MKCKYPVVLDKTRVVTCGKCDPCRINKRREWTHRIMLEASQYKDNCFLTLTYDNEHDPITLVPDDLTKFVKRLRHTHDEAIRFYAVGEYGEGKGRAHFHLCLFNYPTCEWLETRAERRRCCYRCDLVQKTWGQGNVYLGRLERKSAQYVAGYTLKDVPDYKDFSFLQRPFARMSNRPGIGAGVAHEIASVMLEHNIDEVPTVLRHGKRMFPLGRYMRDQIAKYSGVPKKANDYKNPAVQRLSEEIYQNPAIRPEYKQFYLSQALCDLTNDRAVATERKEASRKRRRV